MAERNYDFTEIKTRIIIRNDSAENWAGSEVILEKGEPAIEYDAVNKTAKIKFGDGTSTFSELPFSTLTPTEINSVIGNISSSVSGMQFKGTVGTSGTVTDISSIQSPQNGDTYKIITGITLTSEQSLDGNEHELTVGDIIICSSDKWVFVPSGNEDITSIKIAGSGDTINVSTTAQTGEVVLGTAAGVNTATSVTNDTTTVPTTSAVKTYVDDNSGLSFNYKGTLSNGNSIFTYNPVGESDYRFSAGDIYYITSRTFISGYLSYSGNGISLEPGDVIIATKDKKFIEIPSPTRIALHNESNPNGINVYEYNPGFGDFGTEGTVILGTTAGKDASTTITDTDDLIPTSKAVKTYVDDSVSSISTDSLIDGENILILNGGSATE